MNTRATIDDFLKALKIALNNSAVYSVEHPFFGKSIGEVHAALAACSAGAPSCTIFVSPVFLQVGQERFEKIKLYEELARFFHCRKIKSITITQGVSHEAVKNFIQIVALPVKEIFRQGGIATMLRNAGVKDIIVEDLDYSRFLSGEGGMLDDAWKSILARAGGPDGSAQDVDGLARDFNTISARLQAGEVAGDAQLRTGIQKVLTYLKARHPEKYHSCARALLRMAARGAQELPQDVTLEKLESLFVDFEPQDIAHAVWEEIEGLEDSSTLSFELFARLAGVSRRQDVASCLAKRFQRAGRTASTSAIRRKMQKAFTMSLSPVMTALYKDVLSCLSQQDYAGDTRSLDYADVRRQFHATLLNLCAQESNPEKLGVMFEKVAAEWDEIQAGKDSGFYAQVLDCMHQAYLAGVAYDGSFKNLYERITQNIEQEIFNNSSAVDFEKIVSMCVTTPTSFAVYADKIFKEGVYDSRLIRLACIFFPAQQGELRQMFKKACEDTACAKKIIMAMPSVGTPEALEILKQIYECGSEFIRLEVLRAMTDIQVFDAPFLLKILSEGNVFAKQIAFSILDADPEHRVRAVELLFSGSNYFGINNARFEASIDTAFQVHSEPARQYIEELARGTSPFKIRLRAKARKVLEQWHD